MYECFHASGSAKYGRLILKAMGVTSCVVFS